MGMETGISWADSTFNPWIGCSKVSPGCDRCYAEELMDKRWGKVKWGGERMLTSPANWKSPLKWDREAARTGKRRRVFCASLADVFDAGVPEEWRVWLFGLIKETPNLDWLLLTKRPQSIRPMLARTPFSVRPADPLAPTLRLTGRTVLECLPLPNVWLGTTVESAEYLHRLDDLLAIPAVVHWVSAEPLLGPIDFTHHLSHNFPGGTLDWVIVGGESGAGARPFNLDWAREIRNQCGTHMCSFFMKQLGEQPIEEAPEPVTAGGFPAGRITLPASDKKGTDPQNWPEDLRIQQVPTTIV